MDLQLPEVSKVDKVAVLGVGTMGSGWVAQAASRGVGVVCGDKDPGALERMLGQVEGLLGILVKKGSLEADQVQPAMQRITRLDPGGTEVLIRQMASREPALFIEVVLEQIPLKQEVFRLAGELFGENVVLGSNTSSVLCRHLSTASGHPDRTIVIHGMNPVPLMDGVECVMTEGADPAVHDWVFGLLSGWGKTPFDAPDRPGFLVNRIMMPTWYQCIEDIEQGLTTVGNLDLGMKVSVSHPQGGLLLLDWIGLPIMIEVGLAILAETSDPRYRPPHLLRRMVEDGYTGRSGAHGGFYDWTERKNPKPRPPEFFAGLMKLAKS